MVSPEKLAIPVTAVWVAVPDSVPPPGLLPMARVTLAANPVAVLPKLSRAVTRIAGVIAAPAGVVLGWPVKTSRFAAAGEIVNELLVAVRVEPLSVALACSVYPAPTCATLRSANVATPLCAGIVLVPDRVSPPGFEAMTIVTLPLKLVSVLPSASWAATFTAGVIATPATAALGCTVNASCVAATATWKSVADSALLPKDNQALAREV